MYSYLFSPLHENKHPSHRNRGWNVVNVSWVYREQFMGWDCCVLGSVECRDYHQNQLVTMMIIGDQLVKMP